MEINKLVEVRILALDFGLKRCGLAWTDATGVIALPLPPCTTENLTERLDGHVRQDGVTEIVVGYPKRLNNQPTHLTEPVEKLHVLLKQRYPEITIVLYDERFTSKIAQRAITESGLGKKKRQDKTLVDSISATLILQNYLGFRVSGL